MYELFRERERGRQLLVQILWQHRTLVDFQKNRASQLYFHASTFWESAAIESLVWAQALSRILKQVARGLKQSFPT